MRLFSDIRDKSGASEKGIALVRSASIILSYKTIAVSSSVAVRTKVVQKY